VRNEANDVTADLVVQAQTIHGGVHHQHIVAGGSPRYRLDPAGPEPSRSLGELPESQLLAARNGVVGFSGRDTELAALRRWLDFAADDRSALLLHGPGGQGKTRLATQFAAQARRAGWRVLAARHDVGGTGAGQHGSQVRAPAEAAGVLVLVDYAERWPAEDLLSLADDPVVAGGAPVRVLLVARSAGWWTGVRHEFTERRFRSEQLRLESLAGNVIDRGALFDEARDRFAAVLGVPGAHKVPRPANLADDAFGLVLAVHMAALAAVDAHLMGQQAPDDPAAVSAYLLDREFAYWQRLFSAGRVRIQPVTMARIVFTAILTRPLAYRQAVELLERVGVLAAGEPAGTVLADHGCCYPPADPGTVLEPLYPDRLAEDFLALLIPGHDVAAYQADAWASEVPAQLLAGADGTATSPGSGVTRAALTMLVEAARRWPHLVRRQLAPLLLAHPELALTAGSAVLSALAELPELDIDVLAAIETQFPAHRQADLDSGLADITVRLVSHELLTLRHPWVLATRLAYLADLLDAAGRHDQALSAITDAVRFRRELAEHGPDVAQSDLARSLLTRSRPLTQLGRHEDALTAIDESLGIYQTLAGRQPGTYRHEVAMALEWRGNCLSRLGRHTEALANAEDAVRNRRALADAGATADPVDLARAAQNLGVQLTMVGRPEDALAASEEALHILRTHAAANPQELQPEFALALSNISGSRYQLGRLDLALDAAREAVAMYRDLAEANPLAFRFALTRALHNRGSILSDLGHRAEGLEHAKEAVRIRREFAAANPVAFSADLARSLDGLAADLIDLGRYDEAVLVTTEAVDILRPLADQNLVAMRHDLARAQARLSRALSKAGHAGPALAAAREAVTAYHVLASADPWMYSRDLADALNVLGNRLSALGRHAETVPHRKKAVRIGRVLARDSTIESRDRLGLLLNNLATSLIFVNRRNEARALLTEAVHLREQLAAQDPDVFREQLAESLALLSTTGG
jgi:tetratricopeptide (TPR) repeat protein